MPLNDSYEEQDRSGHSSTDGIGKATALGLARMGATCRYTIGTSKEGS